MIEPPRPGEGEGTQVADRDVEEELEWIQSAVRAMSDVGYVENISEGARRKGDCANCRTRTTFELKALTEPWPYLDKTRNLRGDGSMARVAVWECLGCDKTSVFLGIGVASDVTFPGVGVPFPPSYTWTCDSVVRVWPEQPVRELPSEAPEEVQSLFREASVAEGSGALRGAAGLYRAAVDALVAEQACTGRDLKAKINDLASKGASADLVDDLHEARIVGNWSLHDGLAFSTDEVADIARLIEDAVEELYVQPRRREAMQAKRQARRDHHTNKSP